MERFDVINDLIKNNNYQTYLEVGVSSFFCFERIQCKFKESVDPVPSWKNADYVMTSDEFFYQHPDKRYDIIFIDGLHLYRQAVRDVANSLKIINPQGTIVLHDCNPLSEELASDFWRPDAWNGSVWKVVLHCKKARIPVHVLDLDNGCGIIKPNGNLISPEVDPVIDKLTYADLEKNRVNWLSLRDYESGEKS